MEMDSPKIRSREPTASEIRAVRDYSKTHGGLKKVAGQVGAIGELIGLPVNFEHNRYAEVLKANLDLITKLTEYAKTHGGLTRLATEVAGVIAVTTLTGGSLDKTRQVIEFLKE